MYVMCMCLVHVFLFNHLLDNTCSYGYMPAYEQYKDRIKIIHFIGSAKPWDGIPAGVVLFNCCSVPLRASPVYYAWTRCAALCGALTVL